VHSASAVAVTATVWYVALGQRVVLPHARSVVAVAPTASNVDGLGQAVSEVQRRSSSSVGGEIWYSSALHAVTLRHSRSVVAVGAVACTVRPTEHLVRRVHTLSDVAVGGPASKAFDAQCVVTAVQFRSVVAVGGAASYCPDAHVADTRLQTRSAVADGGARSNVPGSHCVASAQMRTSGSVGVTPASSAVTSNAVPAGHPVELLLTVHRLTSHGEAATVAALAPTVAQLSKVPGSGRHTREYCPRPVGSVHGNAWHEAWHVGVGSHGARYASLRQSVHPIIALALSRVQLWQSALHAQGGAGVVVSPCTRCPVHTVGVTAVTVVAVSPPAVWPRVGLVLPRASATTTTRTRVFTDHDIAAV